MRRLCFGMALLLLAAAARADEEEADRPNLVQQTGGHTAAIWKLLFTPDGKEIVSVSEDKTVRVWDAAGGECLRVIRPPVGAGPQGELRAGALSPDGKTLAVGGVGFGAGEKRFIPIYLIDLAGGGITATLQGSHKDTVFSLAFSHDGKLLASGGGDGLSYLWDVASGRRLYALEEQKDAGRDPAASRDQELPPAIRDLAFSPDDKLLATASWNKTVFLWNVADGKKAAGPLQHEDAVLCVAWKDDDTLATGGVGRAYVHLWDRKGNPLRHLTKKHTETAWINSIAFLPGKEEEFFYVWTEHLDKTNESCESGGYFLNLAQPDQSRGAFTWHHATTEIRGALSPDGRLGAAGGGNEDQINLWSLQRDKKPLHLAGKGRAPYRVGWGQKGGVVAWTHLAKEGRVADDAPLQGAFNLSELRFSAKPDATFGRATHAVGDLSAERTALHHVQIKSQKELVADVECPGVVQCYTLLPGDRLAVGFTEQVHLYNARTGALIRKLGGHMGKVWDLAPSPDGRYLLGAFSDRTLRIWDPNQEQPLLSLLVPGSDWIVWTREGYYAASPGGERIMGWQVNHGLDQLGSFYPAQQFHKALYRPDIIQRVLAEGSVAKARAAADIESGQTTAAVDVASALPPEVTIHAPAAGVLKTADVEVLASAVSADHPVVSLRLLLDGRPFPSAEVKSYPKAKAGEKPEADWKVTLPEGEHVLSVLAESDVSSAVSTDLKVAYQASAQEPLPTLYVLAVGIDAYPGSLKLNSATDDATAIQKAFTAGGAPRPYGKVEAKVLLDDKATKQGILAGLDWLGAMTTDDTAVVFYAGHGHRDKKTSQFYMLPSDVDVSDLPGTGVTGTQIKEKLQAVPGRVLVLLDACHSGSIGQSPPDPASLTDDVRRQLAAPDCGVVILCAAMAQEEAGEAAAVKHGFFTAALLKGLGGEAPPDRKDGLIHLTGLNYYVEQEVAELSKDEQHVVVDRPSTVTSFPLVKPGGKAE